MSFEIHTEIMTAVTMHGGAMFILFLTSDGVVKSGQKISNSYGNLPVTLGQHDQFGSSLSAIGDMDSDGVTDLMVGATDDDDGYTYAGGVFVLFLTSDGLVKSTQKISALYGNFPYTLGSADVFGSSASAIGDADGDGVPDAVVGAFGDDDGGTKAGAVYVTFLTSDGLIKSAQKISNSYGNLPYALSGYVYLGESVSAIGDVNGDGVTDLAVGAYGDDDGSTTTGLSVGAVYVLFLDGYGAPTPAPTAQPTPLPTPEPSSLATAQPTPLPTRLCTDRFSIQLTLAEISPPGIIFNESYGRLAAADFR